MLKDRKDIKFIIDVERKIYEFKLQQLRDGINNKLIPSYIIFSIFTIVYLYLFGCIGFALGIGLLIGVFNCQLIMRL
jgi:hypothetical protein